MTTYTDSFTDTDAVALNVHDANWTGTVSGIGTLAISGNQLGGAGYAVYAQPLEANCYVQATIGTGTASFTALRLLLRKDTSASSSQGVKLRVQTNYLYLYDSSASTVWSAAVSNPVGTVIRAEAEGTDLRIYRNGTLYHTYAGLTTAGGASKYAGLSLDAGTYWDDWSAGDLVAANQTASPESDISNSGWTPSAGTTLTENIDEVTPADADYIYCTASGSVAEVKLAAVSQPDTGTCTLSYRLYSPTADNVQVDLVQNTTVRQTWNHNPAPTTVTQYDQTITTPASITDWANLRLRFTATTAV